MFSFPFLSGRFELKYLISEEQVPRIRETLLAYCEPDVHNHMETGYSVRSLYLDTPTLAFHKAKMRDDADRFKLRIRTYADTGGAHLEIKRKTKEVITKKRATVPQDMVIEAVSGGAQLGPEGQWPNLSDFSRLAALTGAEPITIVDYHREAYVSTVNEYARVTFDRRLRYQHARSFDLRGDPRAWIALDTYWRFDGLRSPVVLELKCENQVPYWLADLIRGFNLRLQGFSKYSYSILAEQRLDHGLGIA